MSTILTYDGEQVGVLGERGEVLEVVEGKGFIGLLPKTKEMQGERVRPQIMGFVNPVPAEAWRIGYQALMRIYKAHETEGVVHFYRGLEGEAGVLVVVPKQEADRGWVEADEKAEKQLQEAAAEAGMVLIGTMHSHPWCKDPGASGTDYKGWQETPGVHGIAGRNGVVTVYLAVRKRSYKVECMRVPYTEGEEEKDLDDKVYLAGCGEEKTRIEDQVRMRRWSVQGIDFSRFATGWWQGNGERNKEDEYELAGQEWERKQGEEETQEYALVPAGDCGMEKDRVSIEQIAALTEMLEAQRRMATATVRNLLEDFLAECAELSGSLLQGLEQYEGLHMEDRT